MLDDIPKVGQDGIVLNPNTVRIVKDCMKTGNNSTGIVQRFALFHVIVIPTARNVVIVIVITIVIILGLQPCGIDNHGHTRWRDESQTIIIQSITFTNLPFVRHTDAVQIISKYRWIRFQWWPFENVSCGGCSCCCGCCCCCHS